MVMRKALLGIVLSLWIGCGDDIAVPPGPDGGVTAMHPGEPPPITCAPGWVPTSNGLGCYLPIDAMP